MQEIDKYKPTIAEKRILEVALNPDNYNMNIQERCKLAKTSRETWYKAMNKKGFIELLNTLTMDLLKGKVANVVNATYKFATTDSKCASDRKVLLTMAGLYTDKQQMEVSGETTVNNKMDFSGFTTDQLKEVLKNNNVAK